MTVNTAARACAAVAVLIAAGCTHMERAGEAHDGLTFEQRRTAFEAVDAWQMRGRLAVDTGERAYQGSFRWVQDDAWSTLSVRGPLGAGAVEIAGSPERMTVRTRGDSRVLEDPEQDLSALLGWWMPVESLRSWLLGLPDPAFEAETRIGPGAALASLDQRLWRVEYGSYQVLDGLLVPRRIDMTHGDLEVRLTVDTWGTARASALLELPAAATAQ